jgi:acetyl esterase/lipase
MSTRRTFLTVAAVAPAVATSFGVPQRVRAQVATPSAGTEIAVETDVLYGEPDEDARVLDIYQPPASDVARPAVLVIHGGAWTEGIADRTYMAEMAQHLAEAGYVTFNLTYRLITGDPSVNVWPDQLNDVQRAVRWVRANAETYGVDPDRIASLGHSAGGHLAAFLGVRETNDWSDPTAELYSSRVNCVVDLAGDMDLTQIYPAAFDNQVTRDLLGGSVEEVPDQYRDASPLTWVNAETVPFLVIHAINDEVNLVAHAHVMVAALHDASVETVFVALGRGGHGAPMDWTVTGPWILTFLATQLHPEQ